MSFGLFVGFVIVALLLYKLYKPKKTPVRDKLLAQKKRSQSTYSPEVVSNSLSASASSYESPSPTPAPFTGSSALEFELLRRESLSMEQGQALTTLAVQSQKPHPALFSLTQEISEPSELFPLIKSVPEIAARILKTVNSPMFALRKPITNINHATIFLGVTTVKSIALFYATQDSFTFENAKQAEVSRRLWRASQLASSFGFMMAQELGKHNAGDIFTYCLLSYLGDTATISHDPKLARLYNKETSLLSRTKKIQEELEINPAMVGAEIAQHWQLPSTLIEALDTSLDYLVSQSGSTKSHEEQEDNLLCYLACRFGDSVALLEQHSFSRYGLYNPGAINREDFLFIPAQMEALGLEKVDRLFKDAAFVKKVNRLISET